MTVAAEVSAAAVGFADNCVNAAPGLPHIVAVLAHSDAVRNFLHSDTLRFLGESARVTLLTPIDDERILARCRPYLHQVIALKHFPEHRLVSAFRGLLHDLHYRWLGTEAAKYHWSVRKATAGTVAKKARLLALQGLAYPLVNRTMLEMLTGVDRRLSWMLRTTDEFTALFETLQPDLVFNCSHVHGPLADFPMRVAHQMGIPTAAFIFSWDNLTTRSRIFVPYDYYLVWNQLMRDQLLDLYPKVAPDRVFVTGTPQFDFHFRPDFWLSREDLCGRIGADPSRPLVLYTTGRDADFREEHRIVEGLILFLQGIDLNPKPQLVVRTYIKGTSPEMHALARRYVPEVLFPAVEWSEKWHAQFYEDVFTYASLVRHADLGINAASTVSLELMMLDKPVINLAFDPPGSRLPHYDRFSRHVGYDHYRPVAESGGVIVARSFDDLCNLLLAGLTSPRTGSVQRLKFIREFFGDTLDGCSSKRIAALLHELACDGYRMSSAPRSMTLAQSAANTSSVRRREAER